MINYKKNLRKSKIMYNGKNKSLFNNLRNIKDHVMIDSQSKPHRLIENLDNMRLKLII
jgi:hypothetical protein